MRKAFRYVWRLIRGVFGPPLSFLAFSIAVGSVIVLFVAGVNALPLDLGDILTILGIWLMIGVLMGQGTSSIRSKRQRSARLATKLLIFYALFTLIALVYVAKTDDPNQQLGTWEVLGLIMLSLAGLSIGYFAGQDRDGQEEDDPS